MLLTFIRLCTPHNKKYNLNQAVTCQVSVKGDPWRGGSSPELRLLPSPGCLARLNCQKGANLTFYNY